MDKRVREGTVEDRKTVSVIYDGKCEFCIRSLEFVKKWDRNKRLAFYDFHQKEEMAEKFPELRIQDLMEAMAVVDSEKEVFRGFFAFRRLLWDLPGLYPLLFFFYFPGAGWIGPKLYAWIARNRYFFGCRSDRCPYHHD